MSLFTSPDKSGQVETFLGLCPPPQTAPPRHHSETRSGKSSHAPPFFITQYYRCLKPCCLATKCFSTALLFWPLSVCPPPPPSAHTHSYTLKYPRNCITEMHSRSPMDHHKAHNTSHFLCFFSLLHLQRRLSWTPLHSLPVCLSVLCSFLHLLFSSLSACTSSH